MLPSVQRHLLSLALLFAAITFLTLAQSAHSAPFTNKVVPRADPRDEIRVLYLEAPLFKLHLGDVLEKVNLFHVGLGFENMRSGENWTVDYIATVSVIDSVFPRSMGDRDMNFTWQDGGHVVFADGIDEEYWTRFTDLYTISGDVFNRFFCWAPTYNASEPNYLLFSIFSDSVPIDEQVHKPIKSGHTCIDFVWTSLRVLHNLGGVKTRESNVLERDLMYLVTNSRPELVDQGNEQEVEQLREVTSL